MEINRFSQQNVTILCHVLIAALCFPGYILLGEFFKILVAPYIFYLVWSRNPMYVPALIIHISPGGFISIVILVLCFLKAIINIKTLYKFEISTLLWFSLLPLPVFLYQTYQKLFVLNYGFIESLTFLSFYLGIFAFFYGVLLSPKITSRIWKWIIAVLLILFIFNWITPVILLRASSFGFIIFCALGFMALFPKTFIEINRSLKLIGIIFLGLIAVGIISFKFNTLFSALFAILIVFFYIKNLKWLLAFLTRKKAIALFIVTFVVIINYTYDFGAFKNNPQEFSYTNVETYPEFIKYKAFGDRGALWIGVWQDIMADKKWMPPYEVETYEYISIRGALIEDVEFGAHNIVLELLRNYGIIIGALISLSYLWIILLVGKALFWKKADGFTLLFSASALGSALVVGMTGQYVLMLNYSFLLMGVAGICYGSFFLNRNKDEGT